MYAFYFTFIESILKSNILNIKVIEDGDLLICSTFNLYNNINNWRKPNSGN